MSYKKLAVICARSGSKGIKDKNLLKIGNKSLIEITIEHALQSKIFDDIVFSSDSKRYLNEAKKRGIKILHERSNKLTNSSAPKIPSIRSALIFAEKYKNKKYDYICDLDVTSPLRKNTDIKNSFNKFFKSKDLNNQLSVIESQKNPYFNMFRIKNHNLIKIFPKISYDRRQNIPFVLSANASIYWWKRNYLIKSDKIISSNTGYFLMSKHSIDIDDKSDYLLIKFLIEKNGI